MSRRAQITDGRGKTLALPSSKQTGLLQGIEEMLKLPPAAEKLKGLPWYETQSGKALPPTSKPLALPAPPSKKDKKGKKGKKQETVLVVAPKFEKVKFSNDDGQYSRERPVQTVREFGLFEDFVGSGRPDPFFL